MFPGGNRQIHPLPTVKTKKKSRVVLMMIFLFLFKLYYLLGWLGDKVKMKFNDAFCLCCCGWWAHTTNLKTMMLTPLFHCFIFDTLVRTFNRRHNKDTHHTAIIQLAFAGTIAGFDIDTSFFDGSHPSYASVEGCLIVKGVKDSYEVRFSVYGTERVCPAAFFAILRVRTPICYLY